MAAVEEQRSTDIAVENPATGEVIGSVHATTTDELRAIAERGRAAQPAWEALGFDGRGKILRRAQKWVVDKLESLPTDGRDRPREDARIDTLEVGD